jgi:hypothetical protein
MTGGGVVSGRREDGSASQRAAGRMTGRRWRRCWWEW